MSLAELLALARERGLDISGVDTANPRRVIRLIETNGARPKRSGLRSNTCVIGLKLERDQLATRVQKRVATMLKQGLENEAKLLSQRYGWDCEAMKASDPTFKAFLTRWKMIEDRKAKAAKLRKEKTP